MLIKDLYTVKKTELIDNVVNAIIKINPEHNIFNGHFPGNPVLPGVIQLQIIKELLETELKLSLILQKASNIKYTNMIVPNANNELHINVSLTYIENTIKVNSVIKNSDIVFLKFKGIFAKNAIN